MLYKKIITYKRITLQFLGVHEARDSPSTPPSYNPAYRIESHEKSNNY